MSVINNINNNATNSSNSGNGIVKDNNVPKGKDSLTKIIFGEDVQIDKYNQVTLQKTIDLKIEQERTKQQYYKLENTNKTIELLTLSSRLNIPLSQLSSLWSPVSIKSDISQSGINNSKDFKFPATSTHDSNKLTVPPNGMITNRRINSPARIGANAVASLAINNGNRENMIIKEEEDDDDTNIDDNSAISPLTKKLPTFHNYITSRDSVYNAKPIRHSRNLSLPAMNKFTTNNNNNNSIITSSSPHIPEGMTSILSFNNVSNDSFIEKPKPESAHSSNLKILEKTSTVNNPLKTHNSIQKKHHRRAKSANSSSAFGVIDLKVTDENPKNKKKKISVEEAKRKALIANILAYGKKTSTTATATAITNKTDLKISKEKQEFDDMDEKTCSESSSSKCQSPSNYNNSHTRTTSSVQNLLND